MPKKTKQMGWYVRRLKCSKLQEDINHINKFIMSSRQCSECDKESGNSEMEDVEAPRKLRYSKEDARARSISESMDEKLAILKSRRDKKRRREKHERYSPEPLGAKKHKKKKKTSKVDNLPRIKIKVQT